MIEAPHYSSAGAKRQASFTLPADYFDGTVNEPVLHQIVQTFGYSTVIDTAGNIQTGSISTAGGASSTSRATGTTSTAGSGSTSGSGN